MTRQEMLQQFDGQECRPAPKMGEATKRARARASQHIRAALAELAQIGPQQVGIGKAVMDCEMILNLTLDDIES